nr:MAG TPA: hypothetical protein [Caudoviricetes sp.]
MTRKRYVKLLMACGFPRCDCEEAARAAQITHASYRQELECWEASLRIVATNCLIEYEAQFRQRAADILHRALYGEVTHE